MLMHRSHRLASPQPGRKGSSNGLCAIVLAIASTLAVPAAHAAAAAPNRTAAAAHPTTAFWLDVKGTPAAVSARGSAIAVDPVRYRALTLDAVSMAALAAGAPMERSQAARQNPLIVALPNPNGGFDRFTLTESPVMEPALAAKHPQIKTFAGIGIDDPSASMRMDITQLGLHASVRSAKGNYYVEPYYRLDDSLYVSYRGSDLRNSGSSFAEAPLIDSQLSVARGRYRAADSVQLSGAGFAPGATVTITVQSPQVDTAPRQTLQAVASRDGTLSMKLIADPYKRAGSYTIVATDGRTTGTTTYLVVDDKAPLDASVGTQLRTYRLALVSDPAYANYFGGSANVTAAKVTLINRVTQVYESETAIRLVLIANNDLLNIDTAAQFTSLYGAASVSCSSATLTRNQAAVDSIIGTANYDIGHIGVGAGGGGIAGLGVVGSSTRKAQGCTGLPTPVGDLFAVDYVAHEMGHQFGANHTFNGTGGSCAGGNRSAANSVEPGSGSSIMAYAGICTTTDDLQPHSDAYWSQRSFDEITTFVASSAAAGGAVTPLVNTVPLVTAPAASAIPIRTPFALTGSGSDADGDTVTYMWEQNDRGVAAVAMTNNVKVTGPLFRQFGTQALVTNSGTLLYNSPGENIVTTNPTRVFPDLAQIVANNTNAESGTCPTVSGTPTAAQIDCFSEFLPTATYTSTALNFRLTVRDGKGGVNSANTVLTLAPLAGPFLVTSPNTAVTYSGGSTQTVTWNVANTNIAPVNTSNVKISLSTDGGLTYPIVLAASVPNTGSAAVTVPVIATTTARIKVEAVGNVFFDISNANFTINTAPVLPPVRPPIREP